jgi:hypothetical protein
VRVLGKFWCEFSRRRFGAPEFTLHHNTTITQKASAIKAQKGRSTHVIVAASGVKGAITSKKAGSQLIF